MPELAEVEHSRRRWDPGLGHPIREVLIPRPDIRVFRGIDTQALRRLLVGQRFLDSQARGKQMLFHFSPDLWLGIHLGMSGELRCEDNPSTLSRKHDHLVLRQTNRALIFEDTRHFGRIRLHQGIAPPDWWTSLAPSVLSEEFTHARTLAFLQRRRRTPVKAVLLMQEHFPGVGNWMADEILWRARVHPSIPAGALDDAQTQRLWEQVRWVSRTAVEIISDDWTYPPDWLFTHRWETGGQCPGCQTKLDRATIGGRTTCWCPHCQLAATAAEAPRTKVSRGSKRPKPSKAALAAKKSPTPSKGSADTSKTKASTSKRKS